MAARARASMPATHTAAAGFAAVAAGGGAGHAGGAASAGDVAAAQNGAALPPPPPPPPPTRRAEFDAAAVEVGATLWISDPDQAWMPCRVVELSKTTISVLVDGATDVLQVPRDDAAGGTGKRSGNVTKRELLPRAAHDDSAAGTENMDDLVHLHEAAILHNICCRFSKDLVYTSTGPILIAMNPYKWLPLYTDDMVAKYHAPADPTVKLPPHCYAVAESCVVALQESADANVSIIICGESGAGKTETTKIILQYISKVASVGATSLMSSRIMESNPLMEAFGNAKTLRNNNSSRFGKFVKLFFNENRIVIGAGITNYLLEKSRCVTQPHGERNYHIFYQLCAGCSDADRTRLRLSSPDAFHYLRQSGCFTIPGVSDAEEFAATMQAFETLGLSHATRDAVLRILTAILHLGNVDFLDAPEGEQCTVQNPAQLHFVAELLRVPPDELDRSLRMRIIGAGGSIVASPLNRTAAISARDALAKAVYDKLFDDLIHRINASLNAPTFKQFIGVLDIYGFENMPDNGFEQLFINYANEKLQALFNHTVFQMEQIEYGAEGIPWTADAAPDNQECVDMLEKKPGILSMIDEECLLGQGSDDGLLRKMHAAFKKSTLYEPAGPTTDWKGRQWDFVIRHYAGPIVYHCEQFLDKNRDTLLGNLRSCISGSSCEHVAGLFPTSKSIPDPSSPSAGATRGKVRRSSTRSGLQDTVASRFRTALIGLVDTIASTSPRFVRCIKSTSLQRPNHLEPPMVLRQLKYAGVMAALNMRRLGYPTRLLHAAFCQRYRVMLTPSDRNVLNTSSFDARNAVLRMLKSRPACDVVHSHEWALGHTKVFLRAGVANALDMQVFRIRSGAIVLIQACSKSKAVRMRVKAFLWATCRLQSGYRMRAQRRIFLKALARSRELRAKQIHIDTWKQLDRDLMKAAVDAEELGIASRDLVVQGLTAARLAKKAAYAIHAEDPLDRYATASDAYSRAVGSLAALLQAEVRSRQAAVELQRSLMEQSTALGARIAFLSHPPRVAESSDKSRLQSLVAEAAAIHSIAQHHLEQESTYPAAQGQLALLDSAVRVAEEELSELQRFYDAVEKSASEADAAIQRANQLLRDAQACVNESGVRGAGSQPHIDALAGKLQALDRRVRQRLGAHADWRALATTHESEATHIFQTAQQQLATWQSERSRRETLASRAEAVKRNIAELVAATQRWGELSTGDHRISVIEDIARADECVEQCHALTASPDESALDTLDKITGDAESWVKSAQAGVAKEIARVEALNNERRTSSTVLGTCVRRLAEITGAFTEEFIQLERSSRVDVCLRNMHLAISALRTVVRLSQSMSEIGTSTLACTEAMQELEAAVSEERKIIHDQIQQREAALTQWDAFATRLAKLNAAVQVALLEHVPRVATCLQHATDALLNAKQVFEGQNTAPPSGVRWSMLAPGASSDLFPPTSRVRPLVPVDFASDLQAISTAVDLAEVVVRQEQNSKRDFDDLLSRGARQLQDLKAQLTAASTLLQGLSGTGVEKAQSELSEMQDELQLCAMQFSSAVYGGADLTEELPESQASVMTLASLQHRVSNNLSRGQSLVKTAHNLHETEIERKRLQLVQDAVERRHKIDEAVRALNAVQIDAKARTAAMDEIRLVTQKLADLRVSSALFAGQPEVQEAFAATRRLLDDTTTQIITAPADVSAKLVVAVQSQMSLLEESLKHAKSSFEHRAVENTVRREATQLLNRIQDMFMRTCAQYDELISGTEFVQNACEACQESLQRIDAAQAARVSGQELKVLVHNAEQQIVAFRSLCGIEQERATKSAARDVAVSSGSEAIAKIGMAQQKFQAIISMHRVDELRGQVFDSDAVEVAVIRAEAAISSACDRVARIKVVDMKKQTAAVRTDVATEDCQLALAAVTEAENAVDALSIVVNRGKEMYERGVRKKAALTAEEDVEPQSSSQLVEYLRVRRGRDSQRDSPSGILATSRYGASGRSAPGSTTTTPTQLLSDGGSVGAFQSPTTVRRHITDWTVTANR